MPRMTNALIAATIALSTHKLCAQTAQDLTIEVQDQHNQEAAHTLAGTLLLPDADAFKAPFPAVVLMTGSGPQDRNETILGHQPFKVIADALAANGIATLRCDDRGFAESTGTFITARSEDFATDAQAQINHLAARPEIDATKLGILGHSQGGLAAIIAASRDANAEQPNISFIILSGSPGTDGVTVMVSQGGAVLKGMGRDDQVVAASEAIRRDMMEMVIAGATQEEIEAKAKELVVNDAGRPFPEATLNMVAKQAAAQFVSPLIKGFIQDNPEPYLKDISDIPVLILNGSLDVQVLPDINVPPLEQGLAAAGNTNVTTHILEGHNHLLQEARTGMMQEYSTIDHAISKQAIKLITDWTVSITNPSSPQPKTDPAPEPDPVPKTDPAPKTDPVPESDPKDGEATSPNP